MRIIKTIIIMSFIIFFESCTQSVPIQTESKFLLQLQKETEHFKFYCGQSDIKCLDDLANSVESNYLKIIADFDAKLNPKVKVYVYRDINTFHDAIGDSNAPDWLIACADGFDIKMVSPLNPGKEHNYDSVINIMAHELTHVVIYILNPTIDYWLSEGIAYYEANQEIEDISNLVKREEIPSLEGFKNYTLEEFASINGPSFAYTVVEYIIEKYGFEKLNKFIKTSLNYEDSFEVDISEFEKGWKEYLKGKYK